MIEMYYFSETDLIIEFDMHCVTRQKKEQILKNAEKCNGKGKRVG